MLFDLFWYHNNGVFALQINPCGRFARFIQRREAAGADSQKSWVFGTPEIFKVEDRWEVSAADLRAYHGNLHAWKELCEWIDSPRVGITRERAPFHVPFSNGWERGGSGDFAAWEYTYRRDDNPQSALNAFRQVLANEAADALAYRPVSTWSYDTSGRMVER